MNPWIKLAAEQKDESSLEKEWDSQREGFADIFLMCFLQSIHLCLNI